MEQTTLYCKFPANMTGICDACDLASFYQLNEQFYMDEAHRHYRHVKTLFRLNFEMNVISEESFCCYFFLWLNLPEGNSLADPLNNWLSDSNNHIDVSICGMNIEDAKRCFAVQVCKKYLAQNQ